MRRLGKIKARRGRPPAVKVSVLRGEDLTRGSLLRKGAVTAVDDLANGEGEGAVFWGSKATKEFSKEIPFRQAAETRGMPHQGTFCLLKRLHQGGFISFAALQAAYKFRSLHRFYLSSLEAPQCAQGYFYGKGSHSKSSGSKASRGDSEEEIRLWEWRQASLTLESFGVKGGRLLKEVLREGSALQTCDEIYILRDILEALASTFSGFWSNISESSCALGRQAV